MFFNPGDVLLDTFTINGASGTIDCLQSLRTFSIYESIFSSGIVGEFTLLDTDNLTNILPLQGNETISLSFTTPTKNSATYNMIVNSISGQMSGENLRHKMYILKAASPHALDNAANIVQKSYATQLSNVVQDLFNTYLGSTGKPLNLEATKGLQNIIIPNKRPLSAIDMIRRRSTSALNQSAAFLFFENSTSFNFVSLESLFQSDVGDRIFTQQSAKNYSLDRVSFRDVITLNFDQQFDMTKSLASGAVSSQVRQFDINTLSYTIKNITIDESSYTRAASGVTIPSAIKAKFNNPGITFTLPIDSFSPPTSIAETTPHQSALTTIAGNIIASINVYGDSELTVGQACQLNIYVKSALTDEPSLEPNISGKYIISRLRHFIDNPGKKPRYINCLDLMKGSLESGAI